MPCRQSRSARHTSLPIDVFAGMMFLICSLCHVMLWRWVPRRPHDARLNLYVQTESDTPDFVNGLLRNATSPPPTPYPLRAITIRRRVASRAWPDLAPLYAAIRHRGDIPAEMETYRSILADPNDLTMTPAEHALSDITPLGPGEPEIPRLYATKPVSAFQHLMREGAPEQLSGTRTPAVRCETVLRLQKIPPGGCARDLPENMLNGLSRRFDSAYRRFHPDAPSTIARLALDPAAPIDFSIPYWQGLDAVVAGPYFAAMPGWQQMTIGGLQAGCRGNVVEIITHPLWEGDPNHLGPQLAAAYAQAIVGGNQVRFKSLFEVLRRPF